MHHTALKTTKSRHRWYVKTILLTLTAFIIGLAAPSATFAQSAARQVRAQQFQTAANEFNVPVELLLSISYNQSRWEEHGDKPSTSGGYGLMHLVTTKDNSKTTLNDSAKLINTSSDTVKKDDQTNIRAGAALLADYAKQTNNGTLPNNLGDWAGAVAKLRASNDADAVNAFVASVYGSIRTGVEATTSDQQTLNIPPQNVTPNQTLVDALHLQHASNAFTPECPSTITCKTTSAYLGSPNGDMGTYGNYSVTDRPKDMDIKYIVIHDMEGYYQDSIDWFQNPNSQTSAHYLVRSSDGEVTQMVPTKDVAWHAGNWYTNMHSIGVEHEGFEAQGATWYSEAMYQSSARLVRYLAAKYHIPLDREHIVGHDQYSADKAKNTATMHTDPGPSWDWNHYMQLLGAPDTSRHLGPQTVATIAPSFKDNTQPIQTCTNNVCQALPVQGSNIVYLRSQPNDSAPLIRDSVLHPDGKDSTTNIDDTAAKASAGERFAIADRQGDWTAIWFGGQKAWLKNTQYTPSTMLFASDFRITPKADKKSIPIYGAAYPEASAYPADGINDQPTGETLPYTIEQGQTYVANATPVSTDYYYTWTLDGSAPHDHTVFTGKERFIPISYNHRQAYVKADDVDIRHY